MAEGSINAIAGVIGQDWEPIASALVAAGIVCAVFRIGLGKLNSASDPLIPDNKLTLRNFSELIAEFIMNIGDGVMGKHNRKYLPFVGTLFLYILVMNLMGLVPAFSGSTDGIPGGIMFNLGIAIVVFAMYHYWGVKEVGLKKYIAHFMGPVPIIAPLIFVIELLSHAFRPVTLSIRLAANMTADHQVLATFIDLTKLLVPILFYCLGTFVCCIQAFVFTMLTMVYIGMATAHEEHH